MALSIDSRAVLRAIADHPAAFPGVQADVDEFVRKTLVKQMKHKSVDLPLMRAIKVAVGDGASSTIIDGLSPSELSAMLKKLDPHNPLLKSVDARAVRGALDDLVAGRAETSQKAVKAPMAKKPPATRVAKPKIGDLLDSKVHSGTPRKKASVKAV